MAKGECGEAGVVKGVGVVDSTHQTQRQTPLPPPPPMVETATEAGGTHPTGMHSSFENVRSSYNNTSSVTSGGSRGLSPPPQSNSVPLSVGKSSIRHWLQEYLNENFARKFFQGVYRIIFTCAFD